MKFGTQQEIWNSAAVTWPNVIFLNARWRTAAILKSFFGHNAAADCPISVKFCVRSFSQNFGSGTDRPTLVPQNVIFCFPNALWASASGGFRIVSDTAVLFDRLSQDHTPRWATRANTGCPASTATRRWKCFVFFASSSSNRRPEAPALRCSTPPTACHSATRSSRRRTCDRPRQRGPASANLQRRCATHSPRSWHTFATPVIKPYYMQLHYKNVTANFYNNSGKS